MTLDELLKYMVEKESSDLHVTVGIPPMIRRFGELQPVEGTSILTSKDTEKLAHSIITEDQKQVLNRDRELDLSYAIEGLCRFRVNIYWQKDSLGIAIRGIPSKIPTPVEVGIPESIVKLTGLRNGLVLVTGPTGSGKSTTLAALIHHINTTMSKHIITIEDPIEFVYPPAKSIINQREVGTDTRSFANALKSALREDPDVILVGEMRDLETIAATLTIAETGHLAFATLHTNDVAQTIDRIIDVFPPHQQQQIRMMLSVVLRGVVCQQLLPTKDGKGRIAAREVLFCDTAIANMIREGQTPQIYSRLQTGGSLGMRTHDADVQRLYDEGYITKEVAEKSLVRPIELTERI